MSDVLYLIKFYVTSTGRDVFHEWFKNLRDPKTQSIILTRLDRLAKGNPGDHRSIGEGVFELRIHFGPGFRLYYTFESRKIILLLCGGDKSTQNTDIEKAKQYWFDYRRWK